MGDDDLPASFELLVWGAQHSRVLTGLARAKLPPGVTLSAGPMGAVLKIPLWAPPEWVELLLGRIERAQLEGGLEVGLLPDRPLNPRRLREAWASARRTRNVAMPLTQKKPTVTMPGGFADDWWFDEF